LGCDPPSGSPQRHSGEPRDVAGAQMFLGGFYNGLRSSGANAQAYDQRAREQLRALSMRLSGLR
jgi:hypothetical protein